LINKYGGEKHMKVPDFLKDDVDPADAQVLNEED
jgi:hypothetical protein